MDSITIHVDPQEYFQKGQDKIRKGMKHMQELVQLYNGIPEKVGLVDEIMAYLQSLQRQLVQEIGSLAQLREAHVSPNISSTDLRHGLEVIQIGEQNREIEMVMDTIVEKSLCSKRKRWSKVWEDFTKYVGEDGKEWAQCNHCKRNFDGSSSKGTTHLKNHLKSCPGLGNPSGVADKGKEKSVIDPELNGSHLLRKIIKYGLKGIMNDMLDVYQQEKDKLRGYLDKLPCRFNVTIEKLQVGLSMKIWFIDDSWELKNMIICLGDEKDEERVKSWLVDWNIDKKICSMIAMRHSGWEKVEDICNWLPERGSLPVTGHFRPFTSLLEEFVHYIKSYQVETMSKNGTLMKKMYKLKNYVTGNENKFQSAVEKAMSKGKTITSQSVPSLTWWHDEVLDWVMGCREVFCELEHIDPHFKSINFVKEDWDDTTLADNCCKALRDMRIEARKSLRSTYKTANLYLPIFLKWVQFAKSDNHYIREVASKYGKDFNDYWSNYKLVLVISVILDPRFKLDFIVEIFKKEMHDNDANHVYLHEIIDDVTNIFNQYAKGTNNSTSSSSQESELAGYLKDFKCPSDEGFDILEWWRLNSSTYPTLVRMARDFLSIPIFANDEDDFFLKEMKNVCKDLRALNDDDIIEKITFTKIWLDKLENN